MEEVGKGSPVLSRQEKFQDEPTFAGIHTGFTIVERQDWTQQANNLFWFCLFGIQK
jgi:hypothetical protein